MELGKRMKKYEDINRHYLLDKTPIIIRLDGKAFHTFTKGLTKPFDEILKKTMEKTAMKLISEIQGCKIAYTQSDEISLLLTNFEKIESCSWFDNNIQKIASVSASIATLEFNKSFYEEVSLLDLPEDEYLKYKKKLFSAIFDSRVFNLPFNEVSNYFIWRQQDCIKNATQSIAQANFSHSYLKSKNTNEMKELLKNKKNIDFDSFSKQHTRGSIIEKRTIDMGGYFRTKPVVIEDTPLISENKNIIEKYIFVNKIYRQNLEV